MYKGFDKEEFEKDYIYFMEKEGLLTTIINNIVEYAHDTQHISKGQFANFLIDIFEDDEILKYCNDEILTDEQIKTKNKYFDNNGKYIY
jgi:hypothetical protein